jgi:hypothetical protein
MDGQYMKNLKPSHQSELAKQLAQTVELLESLQGDERATFIAEHRQDLAKLELVLAGALSLADDPANIERTSSHSGQNT